jgi:hypothetical protein
VFNYFRSKNNGKNINLIAGETADSTRISIISIGLKEPMSLNINPNLRQATALLASASCWFLAQLILQTLTLEATYSSETLVDFQGTIQRYIPEDRTLHNHLRGNLKYYINCVSYVYHFS